MPRFTWILGTMLILGVTATQAQGHAVPPTAKADLVNAQGETIGEATFTRAPGGVLIRVKAKGLPPGEHGFHVHEGAECHGPGFASAGGHFNPDKKKHGFKNPDGPHAGDLPNVTVAPDGTLNAETLAKLVTLDDGPNSLLREGGTSLMIHAGPDDYTTDPSGNSGARLVCGTIRRTGK